MKIQIVSLSSLQLEIEKLQYRKRRASCLTVWQVRDFYNEARRVALLLFEMTKVLSSDEMFYMQVHHVLRPAEIEKGKKGTTLKASYVKLTNSHHQIEGYIVVFEAVREKMPSLLSRYLLRIKKGYLLPSERFMLLPWLDHLSDSVLDLPTLPEEHEEVKREIEAERSIIPFWKAQTEEELFHV